MTIVPFIHFSLGFVHNKHKVGEMNGKPYFCDLCMVEKFRMGNTPALNLLNPLNLFNRTP